MKIRHAVNEDIPVLAAIEAACFPPAEAASEASIAARVHAFPEGFWLYEENGTVVAFVDGFVTDEKDLTDEMYAQADRHDPAGAWQMIFGVNTLPACRHRGIATRLLQEAVADSIAAGRRGLVLTCKEALMPLYAGVGFVDEGISDSTHGGAVWHQMRRTL